MSHPMRFMVLVLPSGPWNEVLARGIEAVEGLLDWEPLRGALLRDAGLRSVMAIEGRRLRLLCDGRRGAERFLALMLHSVAPPLANLVRYEVMQATYELDLPTLRVSQLPMIEHELVPIES